MYALRALGGVVRDIGWAITGALGVAWKLTREHD